MSNLKRFLSMTLVVFMMISALATTASAKFFDDVDALKDAKLTEAIDLLSEMGIIKGVSADSFDPASNVTRQQMAMFIARIHSATPEYFVPSTSTKDIPRFNDVIDNTYFTAINYCYENQIINGIIEPAENEDGQFDPEGTIIFQDGVKMMVSALGYAQTGLSYPVGYLAKAKEIGLLDGFGLDKMKAGDNMTRADVAGMLYNYFLSNYIEVQMVWNPVQNQYVANQIISPVCEKFGIKKIEGYVAAIEGAALPMTVENPYGGVNSTIKFDLGSVTPKTAAALTGGHDLVIAYITNDYNTSSNTAIIPVFDFDTGKTQIGQIEVPGYSTTTQGKAAYFKTTKASLGIGTDYPGIAGSRELLGCKVTAFVNSTNKNITLPKTVVTGVKTSNATATASVTYDPDNDTGRVSRISSITVGDIKFDQTSPADLTARNGYVFIGNGENIARPVNMTAPVANATSLSYLAGMINRGGAITVDVVDNGFYADGTPNRLVIFTPYEAVYDHSDDPWSFTRGNGSASRFDASALNGTGYKVLDATTFASSSFKKDDAYFISHQGQYVLNYAKLALLAEGTVSAIDNNSVNITRTTNYGYAYADIAIRYNYRDVFYKSLNNRLNLGGSYTGMGTGTTNTYAIAQNDKYKVFAPTSVNPNYGYAGESSSAFFLYKTGTTGTIDTSKHYGYVLSNVSAPQYMANGTMVTPYTVYDINERTQKQVLDANRTITSYPRGTYVIYYAQGNGSHSITATVNPFSIIGATNVLTVTQAKSNLTSAMTALGTVGASAAAFDLDTVIGVALNAQRIPFSAGLKTAIRSLDALNTAWVAGTFTDASAAVGTAAVALYSGFDRARFDTFITDLDTAITTFMGLSPSGLVPIAAQVAYDTLKNTITTDLDALYVLLEDVEIEVFNAEYAGATTAAEKTRNELVLALCEAYITAIQDIADYIETDVFGAIDAVITSLTVSNGSVTPAGSSNLAGTAFLSTNEAGWVTANGLAGINSTTAAVTGVSSTARSGAFNGFCYNTATKEIFVGKPGVDVLANTTTVVDNVKATVNANTPIFIYDIKTQTNINTISRDQLDALINATDVAGVQTAIRSALVVRDTFLGTNNGTARVIYLGVDGDNPTANSYLNRVTNASTNLIVTEITGEKVLIDQVWYQPAKAQDSVNGTITNILISAPVYYTTVVVGSPVYLTASTVPYSGTTYRVAQLAEYNYNLDLTASGIQTIIGNNAYRVVSGSYNPGWSVTTGSTFYNLNGTINVPFVRLSVTATSTGTITAIRKMDDDLKYTPNLTFDSKAYNSSTFGNMTQPNAAAKNNINYGWYVVPVDSNVQSGGVIAIYIEEILS